VTTTTTVTTQPFSGGVPTANALRGHELDDARAGRRTLLRADGPDFTRSSRCRRRRAADDMRPGPKYPCIVVTDGHGRRSVDSLADVAQYYYKTDLRPDMTDNPRRAAFRRREPARKTTRRRTST
jgi:hypothetical protein